MYNDVTVKIKLRMAKTKYKTCCWFKNNRTKFSANWKSAKLEKANRLEKISSWKEVQWLKNWLAKKFYFKEYSFYCWFGFLIELKNSYNNTSFANFHTDFFT